MGMRDAQAVIRPHDRRVRGRGRNHRGGRKPDYSLVIGVQFRPDRPREVPPNFDNLFHLLVERAGR